MSSESAFPFRIEFPPELPITARAGEIVDAIQAHPVLILAGETGSGKTTQIPKMCLAAGRGTRGRIACTQPRRVAALSISRRVAEELQVEYGREVGCKVRFSDQTGPDTRVKFLTDGMLLAEVQGDPMLREYDTIIVDEAHERSLNIDFLLGHLRQLRHRRPDLKIIVTSATIDTQAFSEAFDGAPVIQVSGRTYPVEVVYMPLDKFGSDYVDEEEDPTLEQEDRRNAKVEALHYVDGAVEAVGRILEQGGKGDILVFMPSERDIRETCDQLEERLGDARNRNELIPLFGRLSNAEQQRVFASSQRRKIIVATNIAETSLTLPGIRFVVDTGLSRVSRYSPQARTRRLPIEAVSQSSADQRKGRAGRVAEGVCIRLYSEEDYNERPRFAQPEIQRANLADVILRLKAFGLGDIERFPFINPPAPKAIRAGYGLLEELGALEETEESERLKAEGGRLNTDSSEDLQGAEARERRVFADQIPGTHTLTALGRELARLPVDPTVGRMIIQGRRERCLRELVIIASGLSIQDPRERPLDKQAAADAAHRRWAHPDSDFLTLLNIWEAFHDELERLSQGRLRRFCHDHFLSYVRMREWRDIHAQLMDTLRERQDFRMTSVRDGAAVAGATAGEGRGTRGEGHKGGRATAGAGEGQAAGQTRREGRERHGAEEREEAEKRLLYGTNGYRAIHRCILSGLLGNISYYDDEAKVYKATNDRRVAIFPGSVLFQREDRKKSASDRQKAGQAKPASKTPRWLMASEIVETSRIYARTCSRLDPRWITELGAHLIKPSYSEPVWSPESGRVLVRERLRLYGLEIDSRSVGYGRIKPVHATEIFIREGLVNDTITFPLDFITHNRRVREKIEFSLTRMRDTGYLNLDEALYRFYAERLLPKSDYVPAPGSRADKNDADERPVVSCVSELVDLVRHRKSRDPRFLMIEPEDLRDPESLKHDAEEFPENLPLSNNVIPLSYAYKPGQDDDGVTLEVNVRDVDTLTEALLDWAVPGHLQEKVEHYLRSLPKELRREFVPLSENVPTVAEKALSLHRLRGETLTLEQALFELLRERFSFKIPQDVWADKALPGHLRVRVKVLDDEDRELCASRELGKLRELLAEREKEASLESTREDPVLWRRARARWERPEHEYWAFGDMPLKVAIGEQAGLAVFAYVSLVPGSLGVALRLVKSEEESRRGLESGLFRLLELALGKELMWLERDLKDLRQLGPQATLIAPLENLQKDLFVTLRAWLCDHRRVEISEEQVIMAKSFEAAVNQARADMTGLVPKLVDLLKEVVDLRQTLISYPSGYDDLEDEVKALIPADFLRSTPQAQLYQLGRYLKAKRLRAERARANPTKDAERARLVAPFAAKARRCGRQHSFYWLVEDFRVSLFAQELGTVESVSVNRLEREWAELEPSLQGSAAGPQSETPAKSPAPAIPAPRPVVIHPSAPQGKAERAKSLELLRQMKGAAQGQAGSGRSESAKPAASLSMSTLLGGKPVPSQPAPTGAPGKPPASDPKTLKGFELLATAVKPSELRQGPSVVSPAGKSAPKQTAAPGKPAESSKHVSPVGLAASKPATPAPKPGAASPLSSLSARNLPQASKPSGKAGFTMEQLLSSKLPVIPPSEGKGPEAKAVQPVSPQKGQTQTPSSAPKEAPVSGKAIQSSPAAPTRPGPSPAKPALSPDPRKGSGPLKSFNSLGGLF